MFRNLYFRLTIACVLLSIYTPSRAQWVLSDSAFWSLTGPVNCFARAGSNLFAGASWTYSGVGAYLGGGVYLSNDNGATWNTANTGLTDHHYVFAMASVDSDVFAGTSDNGVYLSSNGGASWSAMNSGLGNLYISAFAVEGSGLTSLIFVGTQGGVYLSKNLGATWTAANNGLSGSTQVSALATIGTYLFAGTQSGFVYLSTDYGASWNLASSGLPLGTSIVALAVIGSDLFAGTPDHGVYVSTNSGTSWVAANAGLSNPAINALISVGPTLAVGTYGGGIFISSDNAATWAEVNTGLSNLYTDALIASGADLLTATGAGVYRRPLADLISPLPAADTVSVPFLSTGSSSVTLSGDSDKSRPYRIDFINASKTTLGITNATLTTPDNHFTIAQTLPGTPDSVAPGGEFSVVLNFFGDISGTTFLDTVVLTIDPNDIITSYSLYITGNSFSSSSGVLARVSPVSSELKVFPNPSNEATTVQYGLAEDLPVTIEVYDALGRLVERPVENAIQVGGLHQVAIDTRGLPPGLYSCRLTAGLSTMLTKLSIVR